MANINSETLTRRHWITAAGSSLVLGLAGCSSGSDSNSSESEDGTDPADSSETESPQNESGEDDQSEDTEQETLPEQEYDTPEKAAADFIRAMYLPDIESANELIHTESPVSEVSESDIEWAETRDEGIEVGVEITEVTVQEETETTARVGVDRGILFDGEVGVSGVTMLNVRQEGDKWRVVIEEHDLPI
jgi:hypothetical protein